MRTTILILLLLLAFSLALAAPVQAKSAKPAKPRAILNGHVLWVHDGDTVDVLTSNLSIVRVRLYGIDCPESDQFHGLAATLFSAWHGLFRAVEVRVMDRDRYGRSVGWVIIKDGGGDLSRMLVENGHAWVYERYCAARECVALAEAQDAARRERLGLWLDPEPMPPWEWRRRGRSGRW